MATVYKRGKLWWARWYRNDRTRISRSTGLAGKREAQREAARLEAEDRKTGLSREELATAFQKILDDAGRDAKKGTLDLERARQHLNQMMRTVDPTYRVVTVAEQIEEWVQSQAGRVSASTHAGYGDMQRRFLAALGPAVAKMPVGDLTTAHIERALLKITKTSVRGGTRTVRAATANLDLNALRRALQAAVVAKRLPSNPAAAIRPLPTTDSSERAPFSAAEVRMLIDHPSTPHEWRGAILLAAHTGLRLRDVMALGRQHLDGSKLVIRPAKTAKTRKTLTVPLTPPCVAWISEQKGEHWFPELREKNGGTLSSQFRAIMRRADVPHKISLPGGIEAVRSFHSLRHSFASWLAEADVHADVRQKLTGHSSAGMHARYTHHEEALDRAIRTLPGLTGS